MPDPHPPAADGERDLPEEIVKAITRFECEVRGFYMAPYAQGIVQARSALTTSILSRLTAAEAGREEACRERDDARCVGEANARAADANLAASEAAEAARDAALARVEKLEKALAEFGEQAPAIGADALCPFNDEGALDLPDNFDAADPCPICGDLSSHDNGGKPVRCIAKDRR